MTESSEIHRIRPGCGVQGCLFAAVALFVLLLIGVLIVAFFRFQEPPAGPPRPMSAVSEPSPVAPPLSVQHPPREASPPEPTADSRRPTAGAVGKEAVHA